MTEITAAEAPELLRLRPHGLDFAELKGLIEYLEQIEDYSDDSLAYFRHLRTGGFQHRVDPGKKPRKSSKASTATCLAYLHATGKLVGEGWEDSLKDKLRAEMIDRKWTSAGLKENNPFTVSFLLDAIHALGDTANLVRWRTIFAGGALSKYANRLTERTCRRRNRARRHRT